MHLNGPRRDDVRSGACAVRAGPIDDVVALFPMTPWSTKACRGRGTGEIRAAQEGRASLYQYTTEVFGTHPTDEDEYLVTGRIEGNFPGGSADLRWGFTLAGDRITPLHIAP